MSIPQIETVIKDYVASSDPLPHETKHIIGDGDFRAIGTEFLGYFVNIGGLTSNDDVLDIGCGFGRMALPLVRYLSPEARYLGFDIVAEPIDWCSRHVAPLHPGFAFCHLEILHPLYNPIGPDLAATGFLAGLPDAGVFEPSFVIATSVFTHLEQASIESYLADIGALLRPGGTLFLTAFLAGEGAPLPGAGCVFPVQAWRHQGPLIALMGAPLTAAVGIAPGWLLDRCAANGLLLRQVHYGHWRWGAERGGSFQDMLVLTKPGSSRP